MAPLPWKFEIRSEGAVQSDPFEEEFFIGPSDNELDDAHVASLVRESIQNAIDARAGSEPVRVTFALHEASVAETGAIHYLEGLAAHLAALVPPVPWPAATPDATIRWLVYEDYHTTGLCGDPAIVDDPPPGHPAREDFYWFWRNVGRSAKTGEKLGRWGLGKTVFPSSSGINTIIGLTHRADDDRLLLMGQAVLRNHTIKPRRYLPYGLLSDPEAAGKTPMPLESPAAAAAVSDAFRLRRRKETGLSIVVPFVRDGITAESIARSVCSHFFIRILRGELVVETIDERGHSLLISADTIDAVASQVPWVKPGSSQKASPPPLALARLALDRIKTGSPDAVLPPTFETGATAWSASAAATAIPASVAKTLAADGATAVLEVPIDLERADGERVTTRFHVALRRRLDGKGEAWHVRDGMTITAVNRARPAGGDFDGLLLASDPVISAFLGDAEGPAHVEWSKEEKRLKTNWKVYARRLSFLSTAIARLADLCREKQPKSAPPALAKVFSVKLPVQPTGGAGKPDKIIDVEERREWYSIAPKGQGFTVRSVPKVPRPPVNGLRVTFAYDTSSGDPFRIWSPFDFELRLGKSSTLTISGKGVKAGLLDGNQVLLTDLAEAFSFNVEGFDPARDVVVRAEADLPTDAAAMDDDKKPQPLELA